jgi:ABC-type lipoprotein release transport system permease subunit
VIGILEAMESAITLIESLYTVVAVIVLCTAAVAVFLIYEGILEQSEVEIRILRCIGLTKNDLFRMYMVHTTCQSRLK